MAAGATLAFRLSAPMEAKDLIGSFELVSWYAGDGTMPFGADAVGFLHYGADGMMSADLMRNDRAAIGLEARKLREARRVLVRPWLIPFHFEVLKGFGRYVNASANYVGYAGTYEVRGNQLIHDVKLSLVPDWVGTKLVREASIDGGLLILKTPEGDVLTWRRLA